MAITIGSRVHWVSARGYSLPGGEPATVYAVDAARRIACINTPGDDQNPGGYSYAVSFDELTERSGMTLDEFRATGRDVPDLGAIEHCAAQEINGPGRVYLDDEWPLVIERVRGGWCLTIGSHQRVASLATLERDLYEFAVAEGYINE